MTPSKKVKQLKKDNEKHVIYRVKFKLYSLLQLPNMIQHRRLSGTQPMGRGFFSNEVFDALYNNANPHPHKKVFITWLAVFFLEGHLFSEI